MSISDKKMSTSLLSSLLRFFELCSDEKKFLDKSSPLLEKAQGKEKRLLAQTQKYLAQAIRTKKSLENLKIKRKIREDIDSREDLLVEKKLLESYKHLGAINRQISILYNINTQRNGRNDNEIFSYILSSAMNISRAKLVQIHKFDKKNGSLMPVHTAKNKLCYSKKVVQINKYPLLKTLVYNKIRVQGTIPDGEPTPFEKSIRRIIFLPILAGRKLVGVILLGFSKNSYVTAQQLDLFEAFASQASSILKDLDIFKNKKNISCNKLSLAQLKLFKEK